MNEYLAKWYEKNESRVRKLMNDIWHTPEVGLKEYKSCQIAAEFAKEMGFEVKTVAAEDFDNPNATPNTVIAKWGSGKPVIGFVGELDALPGLGQANVPYQSLVEGPGHGCGHNTMAGCAAAGASALKYAMEQEGLTGTVYLVEAPAEEIGKGKSLLAKAGVFKGWDLALMWHPGVGNLCFSPAPMMVMYHVLFEFFGKLTHAASPQLPESRSALDAAQLMNIGCEFLREHVARDTWHHYCYRSAGEAPNIVPNYASVEYYFRALEDEPKVRDLTERAINVAKGAALMTGTEMKYTILSHVPQFFHTIPLNKLLYDASTEVPAFTYSEEDYQLAGELYKNTYGKTEVDVPRQQLLPTGVEPWSPEKIKNPGGTDCADMSYFCPTIHCRGLARTPGADGHNWKVTFISGCALGEKPAVYASKILAQGAYDVLKNPKLLEECWAYYHSLNVPDYSTLEMTT